MHIKNRAKIGQGPAALIEGQHMRNCLVSLACLSVFAGLSGCAETKSPLLKNPMEVEFTSALASSPKVELDYIHAYAAIARGLQQCWLADKMPLQKSKFFARTKNKGEAKKSDIFVHGPAVSPKRGPRIFSVHLTPNGKGTALTFDNRLLDPLTEEKVRADVNRWASGGEGCSKEPESANTITPESAANLKASRIALPVRKARK